MDANLSPSSGANAMRLDQGGSRLIVRENLEAGHADAFEQACNRLRHGAAPVCTVDLGGIEYVCSACVGSLILLSGALQEADRRLVLHISPELHWYFTLFSMDAIATVVVVEAA